MAEAPPREVKPLRNGHSHNDYWRRYPLQDALDNGFCSVEADVFLRNGEFLVGHTEIELLRGRTLEKLYLAPLKERVEKNNGCVYPGVETFYLWIEFKRDAEESWAVLCPLLERYKSMLSGVIDGKKTKGPIQVIITGNRPVQAFSQSEGKTFYAVLDAGVGDMNRNDRPSWKYGAINAKWQNHFTWNGKGEFPPEQREKLKEIVDKAHSQGRILRFWGAPQNNVFWTELQNCGVDLINTDYLGRFRKFKESQPK